MSLNPEQLGRVLACLIEETALKPFQVENTVALFAKGGRSLSSPVTARSRPANSTRCRSALVEERLAYLQRTGRAQGHDPQVDRGAGETHPRACRRASTSTRQKTELEDLYLPYKPKRRTKATIARERGLEPLADLIAAQELTTGTPEEAAAPFVDPEKEVPDAAAALAGAGHILAERLAEDADARAMVRRLTWEAGDHASPGWRRRRPARSPSSRCTTIIRSR